MMETGASLRVTSTERLRDGTFKGFLDLDKVIENVWSNSRMEVVFVFQNILNNRINNDILLPKKFAQNKNALSSDSNPEKKERKN